MLSLLADGAGYLTPETMVPLGTVVVAAITVCIFIIRAIRALDGLRSELHSLNHSQAQLATRLDEQQRETWTTKDMEIWGLKLQIANKDLTVPDAELIARMNDRTRPQN